MSDVSCQGCVLGGIRCYCERDNELAGTMFPSKGGRIKLMDEADRNSKQG